MIHPWSISENQPLLVELIDSGFMTGQVEESVPRVAGLTWMGIDFFNACRHENIRIRLKCRCPEHAPVAQVYAAAIEIHSSHGQERNRYARRHR